jgi:hypothetical protein
MLPSSLSCLLSTRRAAAPVAGAVRNLNVHEYISMDLFRQNGIATPRCYVANSAEEAENIYLHKLNKSEKPDDLPVDPKHVSVSRHQNWY